MAEVEEVFERRAQQLHHQHVVVPLYSGPQEPRDPSWRRPNSTTERLSTVTDALRRSSPVAMAIIFTR